MKRRFVLAAALVSALLLGMAVHAETATPKQAAPATITEPPKPAKTNGPRLSDDKNKLVKEALAKARADNMAVNEQIKAKRKELAALLKAEKFDKAAFLAKHAEMQELIDKTANARAAALANAAEQFSVEERKILARRYDKKKGHRDERKMPDEKTGAVKK